jgi:hypothetical protein
VHDTRGCLSETFVYTPMVVQLHEPRRKRTDLTSNRSYIFFQFLYQLFNGHYAGHVQPCITGCKYAAMQIPSPGWINRIALRHHHRRSIQHALLAAYYFKRSEDAHLVSGEASIKTKSPTVHSLVLLVTFSMRHEGLSMMRLGLSSLTKSNYI